MESDPGNGKVVLKIVQGKLIKFKKLKKQRPVIEIVMGPIVQRTNPGKGKTPYWDQLFELNRSNEGFIEFRLFDKGLISTSMKARGLICLKPFLFLKNVQSQKFSAFRNGDKVLQLQVEIRYQQDWRAPQSQENMRKSLKQFMTGPTKIPEAKPESPMRKSQRISSQSSTTEPSGEKPSESPEKLTKEKAMGLLTRGIKLEDIEMGTKLHESQSGEQCVYNAILIPNGQKVVVKVTYCQTIERYNEIQKEAFTMCQISHPNICKMYTSLLATRNGKFENFLVMENCQGMDINKEIKQRQKTSNFWPEQELLHHFLQLLDAFALLKSQNIVHSDIKPHNIVLTPENTMKIIDFGISLVNPQEYFATTSTYQVGGTIPYFSPAQLQGYVKFITGRNPTAKVRHNPFKSDVYSLGLTFYHMASLEAPNGLNDFENQNLDEDINQIVGRLQYSDTIKDLLRNMMILDERKRPHFDDLVSMTRGNN